MRKSLLWQHITGLFHLSTCLITNSLYIKKMEYKHVGSISHSHATACFHPIRKFMLESGLCLRAKKNAGTRPAYDEGS